MSGCFLGAVERHDVPACIKIVCVVADPTSSPPLSLAGEVSTLRDSASAMMETSRLEEESLRRLLAAAAAEVTQRGAKPQNHTPFSFMHYLPSRDQASRRYGGQVKRRNRHESVRFMWRTCLCRLARFSAVCVDAGSRELLSISIPIYIASRGWSAFVGFVSRPSHVHDSDVGLYHQLNEGKPS